MNNAIKAVEHQTFSGSVLTSIVTAIVALSNTPAFTYAEKVVSVFILAMVAEGGRRAVAKLLDGKKK